MNSQSATSPEWQRCPICLGSGRLWDTLMPTRTVACHGCLGTGMVMRPDPSMFSTTIKGTSK